MIKQNRLVVIDVLKTILIILVILGHCIQYCNGLTFFNKELYYSNNLFKIIYSFHMPLFMIISGFLFHKGINKRTFLKELKSKFTRLIIPILSFSVIAFILRAFVIEKFYSSPLTMIIKFIGTIFGSLWFLWAVFFCSIIVKFIHDYLKDNIYIYFFIIILSFFIPDIYYLALFKFVFPYFLIGYYLEKKKIKFSSNMYKFTPILICTFIIMIKNFDKSKYIYTSGYYILNNFGQLYNNLFRFLIGIIGSYILYILVIFLISKKSSTKIFNFISKRTLGLYLISSIIFDYIFKIIPLNFKSFNLYRTLLIFLIIFIISLGIHILFEKAPILNYLFLGQKSKEKN